MRAAGHTATLLGRAFSRQGPAGLLLSLQPRVEADKVQLVMLAAQFHALLVALASDGQLSILAPAAGETRCG